MQQLRREESEERPFIPFVERPNSLQQTYALRKVWERRLRPWVLTVGIIGMLFMLVFYFFGIEAAFFPGRSPFVAQMTAGWGEFILSSVFVPLAALWLLAGIFEKPTLLELGPRRMKKSEGFLRRYIQTPLRHLVK